MEGRAIADFTLLCPQGLKSEPESALLELLAYRSQIQVSDSGFRFRFQTPSEMGNTCRLSFPIGREIFVLFPIEGGLLGDSRFLFSRPAHGALAEILLQRLLAAVGFLLGDRCVFLMFVPCICAYSQKSLP